MDVVSPGGVAVREYVKSDVNLAAEKALPP